MLRIYPASPVIEAGEEVRLHVSTDERLFHLVVQHWGTGAVLATAGPFAGEDAPSGSPAQPWDWPYVSIRTEREWPAGAYTVRVRELPANTPDARWGSALFVVRGRSRARVLVNLPLFTYHAYNVADTDGTLGVNEGACLYSGERTVTLQRPGGGTGGHPWDECNADAYDRASPRQTFAHWDFPALQWFAREGIDVDVCTDLELHRGDPALERYALLCSFGHDEYWTREKRRAVESFLEAGGNVAFFGGNTCWFRVVYDEATMSITRDGRWCDDVPEASLTGLSFRSGGGKWIGERPATGYRVQHDHPFLSDAGLRTGDGFGAGEALIGYEFDGVDAAASPPDVCLLANASVGHWDVSDGSGEIAAGGHAAMVTFGYGAGSVFNAGTADWSRCLHANEHVAAITRSVVSHLSRDGKSIK